MKYLQKDEKGDITCNHPLVDKLWSTGALARTKGTSDEIVHQVNILLKDNSIKVIEFREVQTLDWIKDVNEWLDTLRIVSIKASIIRTVPEVNESALNAKC